ncbi:MAG: tetratricopeptide repeat protein [Bacteroidetes bacterium]|nr:tetratricopeptide repeat protein [Bacteroidota bacterium]
MNLHTKHFLIGVVICLLSACSSTQKSRSLTPKVSEKKVEPVRKTQNNFELIQAQRTKAEFDNFFFTGQKEKMTGNSQNAVWNFEQALKIEPKNHAVLYELAVGYFNQNQYVKAEDAIKKAVAIDKENKWYRILQADIYQNQRKWADAAKTYSDLIDLYPDNKEFYGSLATYYTILGKTNDAAKVYDRMGKQFGDNEQAAVSKHKLYFEAGKFKEALVEIKKLVEADPTNKRYLQMLAQTYFKVGDNDKAFETFKKLEEKFPGDPMTSLALAEFYYKKGDKPKSSEYLLSAFASPQMGVDQKIQILYQNYLMQKMSDKMRAEAYQLLDEVVKVHPTEAKGWAIYADFLMVENRKEDARIKYRKAIEFRKDVFSVWQQLLTIEFELRDYKTLNEESEKALEYFPSQPIIYYFSGNAKLELKKFKEAAEAFQNGLNLNGDNRNLETQLQLGLAEAYYRQEDLTNAFATFDKVLAYDSVTNLLALNNYAYYLSVKKMNLAKAERMSKKTIEVEPNNASYLDTYGWILFINGKYKEAADYIKKALDLDKTSYEVFEHYGDVLFKLGNTDEAVANWKKAKELGSDSKTIDKKISEKRIIE